MPQKYVLAYLQFLQAAGLHEGRMEETTVPSIIICNTIMLVLASAGVFVKLLMLGHPRNIGADGGTWPIKTDLNFNAEETIIFQVLCVISWVCYLFTN